ncbi:hypothetical protein CCHR01_16951 [Colletotrichum chrysophilum]|uniref:C3H1-type domain-containing protein n=1 Tax=Colletotrichum chrysophilum TaxID=1836956 RepID=A0AAD9E9K5_9PEZI|nr:hypothetical protein CCHR01_16951 [Colletotrichum chrysophilum]
MNTQQGTWTQQPGSWPQPGPWAQQVPYPQPGSWTQQSWSPPGCIWQQVPVKCLAHGQSMCLPCQQWVLRPSRPPPVPQIITEGLLHAVNQRPTCRHYINYCCERPDNCDFPHRHIRRSPAPSEKDICRHWYNNDDDMSRCGYGVEECDFHHPYRKPNEHRLPLGSFTWRGTTYTPTIVPLGFSPPVSYTQASYTQASSPQVTSTQATSPQPAASSTVSQPERWSQQCPLLDKCPGFGKSCPHRHSVIAYGTRQPKAADDRAVGDSSQAAQDDASDSEAAQSAEEDQDDSDDDSQYERPPSRGCWSDVSEEERPSLRRTRSME